MYALVHTGTHGGFVWLPPVTPSFWINTIVASGGTGGGR